ncbi:MAG TPA: hypothetical protein VHD63_14655 [Ktedonobacteraceae bacterium]|nr:hypothetical protein [Ktedonobacteraceae bacterium]
MTTITLSSMLEKQRTASGDFAALSAALCSFRGSSLAIAVREEALKQQGYSAFFTPRQMKRMTRLIRVRDGEKHMV